MTVKSRIKDLKPVKAATEDGLNRRQIRKLLDAGYDYRNGVWHPPHAGPAAVAGAGNAGQGAAGGAANVSNKGKGGKGRRGGRHRGLDEGEPGAAGLGTVLGDVANNIAGGAASPGAHNAGQHAGQGAGSVGHHKNQQLARAARRRLKK